MDRNDFIRERLRQDARLYRSLAVVMLVGTAVGVVMGVIAISQGKVAGGITLIAAGAAFAIDAYAKRDTARMRLAALDEIGDGPTDIEERDDLSPQTKSLIGSVLLRIKDYRGQIVAYAVIGAVMVAGAVLIFAVSVEEPGFLPFAVLLVAGAVLLFRLAAVAAHNRKLAKQLLEIEEREYEEQIRLEYGDEDDED